MSHLGPTERVVCIRRLRERAMFRPSTMLRWTRPIQRNVRNKRIIPLYIQQTSFHTSIVQQQGNEPHGPPMDELPKVPIVNPADKYKEDGEKLHEYGTYLITCLPKFIQKFRYLPSIRCSDFHNSPKGCPPPWIVDQ